MRKNQCNGSKKKNSDVYYTPLITNSPPISNNIAAIPNYPDKQVRYEGYAKVPTGGQEYKLKKQDTRFYYFFFTAGDSSVGVTRTNRTTHTFIARSFVLSYNLTNITQLAIYDLNVSSPKFAVLLKGTGTLSINFEDIPRVFTGTILADTKSTAGAPYVLAAGEFISLTFTGWDEEI